MKNEATSVAGKTPKILKGVTIGGTGKGPSVDVRGDWKSGAFVSPMPKGPKKG